MARAKHFSPLPQDPAVGPLIVFEDPDILVVNKPAGLLTSTVKQEPRPTLLAMVRQYVRQRNPSTVVGLIHRLDRSASGLLIFSKNPMAYESLKQQFFDHSVKRQYMAVVEGTPQKPQGRIESYLVELPSGKIVSQPRPGKGRLAITEYIVLQTVETRHGKRSMLQVTLHTGRKHQIRAHLSKLGIPIVNDPIYGVSRATGRMLLTALRLGVMHPRTGRPMKWELSLPPQFKHAMTPVRSA